MVVVSLLDRFHDEVASFGQTTKEDVSFRRGEGCEVGTRLTQHLSSEFEDFLCHFVTLASSNAHVERCDFFGVEFAKQTWLGSLGKDFASRTSHACSRAISLQASRATTSALATFCTTHHCDMTELTSKAIVSIHQLTVDDYARTNTCSECDDNEILHAACHSVNHFAQSSSVGIVRHGYRNAQSVAEHLRQWHDALPRQVWSILNGACVVVAVWSANTHRLDLVNASSLLDERFQTSHACLNESLNGRKFLCADRIIVEHIATLVHNAKDGVCSSKVNTNYIRFYFIHGSLRF